MSLLEQEAEKEQANTLSQHSSETAQLIENSLRKKETEFQDQLANQQLSLDESNQLIADHQREMEALRESMRAEEIQQKKVF